MGKTTLLAVLAATVLVSSKAKSQADKNLLSLKSGFHYNLGVALYQLFNWIHRQLGKNISFVCCLQLGAQKV